MILTELSKRCERVTGPDEELDAYIALACQPLPYVVPDAQTAKLEIVEDCDGTRRILWTAQPPLLSSYAAFNFDPPPVTASLDAAMTLVPEGCWGAFDPRFMDDEGDVRFYGYIFRPNWPRWTPHGDWVEEVKKSALCHTPALALCAAALRARASQANRQEAV